MIKLLDIKRKYGDGGMLWSFWQTVRKMFFQHSSQMFQE